MTTTVAAGITPGTYSVPEAARWLGIGKDAAYNLIRERRHPFDGTTIRAPKLGRRWAALYVGGLSLQAKPPGVPWTRFPVSSGCAARLSASTMTTWTT